MTRDTGTTSNGLTGSTQRASLTDFFAGSNLKKLNCTAEIFTRATTIDDVCQFAGIPLRKQLKKNENIYP